MNVKLLIHFLTQCIKIVVQLLLDIITVAYIAQFSPPDFRHTLVKEA